MLHSPHLSQTLFSFLLLISSFLVLIHLLSMLLSRALSSSLFLSEFHILFGHMLNRLSSVSAHSTFSLFFIQSIQWQPLPYYQLIHMPLCTYLDSLINTFSCVYTSLSLITLISQLYSTSFHSLQTCFSRNNFLDPFLFHISHPLISHSSIPVLSCILIGLSVNFSSNFTLLFLAPTFFHFSYNITQNILIQPKHIFLIPLLHCFYSLLLFSSTSL